MGGAVLPNGQQKTYGPEYLRPDQGGVRGETGTDGCVDEEGNC